jgi:hypothetical protein
MDETFARKRYYTNEAYERDEYEEELINSIDESRKLLMNNGMNKSAKSLK